MRLSDDLKHEEIQELLGAYALDAVEDQERAIIEAHLATCESCRVELEDHRRLAETMRRHAARMSPLASAEANGSAKTSGSVSGSRPANRWRFPVAMAIALALFGGLFTQGEIRFNELETGVERLETGVERIELLERAQLAITDPAAIVTTLRTPRNEPVLTVVRGALGGDSYAMNSTLPPLPSGQSYQLWRSERGVEVPVIALGRRPAAVMFSLPSDVTAFVLTVETGPTPSRPTLPAVAGARV